MQWSSLAAPARIYNGAAAKSDAILRGCVSNFSLGASPLIPCLWYLRNTNITWSESRLGYIKPNRVGEKPQATRTPAICTPSPLLKVGTSRVLYIFEFESKLTVQAPFCWLQSVEQAPADPVEALPPATRVFPWVKHSALIPWQWIKQRMRLKS